MQLQQSNKTVLFKFRYTCVIFINILMMHVSSWNDAGLAQDRSDVMIDIQHTAERIKDHLKELTVTIGERSVGVPENLEKTANYIESFYQNRGITVHRQPYTYRGDTVVNVIAEIASGTRAKNRFVVGAHYDSVMGTVGADDNASAVAVQLETARQLKLVLESQKLDLAVKFVSFALEEPPSTLR